MADSLSSSDTLNHAGDILLDEVLIVSTQTGFQVNITKMVGAFTIFENIYSNGLSGNILIMDSLNLLKHIPIIGREKVFIKFKTPGVDDKFRKVEMDVYKVSSQLRGEEGQATTVIRLELISPIMTISSLVKMNRVLKNMTYSNMAVSVFEDIKPSLADSTRSNAPFMSTHESQNTPTNLILTNWSPLYALNWLSYRSTASQNEWMSDFLFYQTIDGYYFHSLSKMKVNEAVREYTNIPAGQRSKSGDRLPVLELRTITRYNINDAHDRLKEVSEGMYGASQLVFEMTTKSYYANTHLYNNLFDRNPGMNSKPLINRNDILSKFDTAYLKYHIKPHYTWDKIADSSFVDRSLERQSLLNQMNSFIMSIRVFGDSTLRVGETVRLKIMATEKVSESKEETDRYLSGKYMVIAIAHEYTSGLHEMTVTLAKDSLVEPAPDKKPKEVEIL